MKARSRRFNRRRQDRLHLAAADFLDVAHGLFFDRRQASANIAFGWLRSQQIHALALDEVRVIVEDTTEILADLFADAPGFDNIFAPGQFAGLAEYERGAAFQE